MTARRSEADVDVRDQARTLLAKHAVRSHVEARSMLPYRERLSQSWVSWNGVDKPPVRRQRSA